MTPEEIAAKEGATAAPAAEAKAKAEADAKLSQDPLKLELDKVNKKGAGKTELEKALFTKSQIDKRIADLKKESGEDVTIDEDDAAPVTVGMYKQMEKEKSAKNSLQLADDIEDENERELVKHHLSNTIKASGNPQEDLKTARLIVNGVKNRQIIEEAGRKVTPRSYSSGTGAPAKKTDGEFVPNAEELMFMRSMKLTQEDILKARKATEAKRG